MAKLPTKSVWAPSLAFHDPDPPLALEDSEVREGVLESEDNVGSFNAASSATASATLEAAGDSDAQFAGIAVFNSDATLESDGSGDADWQSVETIEVESSFSAAGSAAFDAQSDADPGESSFSMGGSSDAQFYGERAWVARCTDLFTYDPLGGPEWSGTLRRDPEILLQTQANDSPSQSTFTDEDEPDLGQNVQLDMQDGHGVMLGGTVQSYTTRYEGQPDDGTGPNDHLVFDVVVADYLWLLNKRRPFGCFTNVSASVVAQALLDGYAPPDFSGAGIVAGLPNITVSFDGSLDFSGCMSVICSRIAGHFRVDKDKVLHLFQDDPAPGPQVIDDSNMLLLRDQPITINHDASQLRNRVFVKGAATKLLADTAIGATEIEIDGLDVFNPNGGEAIIGCDRFTYAGVATTLIYPPPDASLQTGPPVQPQWHISPGNLIEAGPIRTIVRYTAAMVFNGKEGPRSTTAFQDNVARFNPGFGSGGTFFPFAGFLPGGAHQWLLAFRDTGGGLYYDLNIGVTNGGGPAGIPGAYEINWNAGNSISNERRIATVVLYRRAILGDPGPPGNSNGWFYEVASQPFIPGVTSYSFTDGKADESLGNILPYDDGTITFLQYDTIGNRVDVQTLSPRNTASNAGAQQLKIYREERFNGIDFSGSAQGVTGWTTPQVVMTFDTTQNVTAADPVYHEDLKPTTAHLYDVGESPSNETFTPPAPKPKTRLILYGVSGLDEAHFEGDDVNIFMQLDDLTAQIAAAQREGGDGLHEYMVVDTALRSDAELAARGNAELTLFKDPIITVQYSTFDNTHTPGGTVEFNLTRPPLVASLKITEVRIDKVHYEHGHVARYNVTASSVKFTLQDLLRRTILRPY